MPDQAACRNALARGIRATWRRMIVIEVQLWSAINGVKAARGGEEAVNV